MSYLSRALLAHPHCSGSHHDVSRDRVTRSQLPGHLALGQLLQGRRDRILEPLEAPLGFTQTLEGRWQQNNGRCSDSVWDRLQDFTAGVVLMRVFARSEMEVLGLRHIRW